MEVKISGSEAILQKQRTLRILQLIPAILPYYASAFNFIDYQSDGVSERSKKVKGAAFFRHRRSLVSDDAAE
jgi:hypothetical protein